MNIYIMCLKTKSFNEELKQMEVNESNENVSNSSINNLSAVVLLT